MTVVVDIGNTNIVVAVEKDGQWNKPFRVFTDTKKTGDEYSVIFSLHSLLQGEWRRIW